MYESAAHAFRRSEVVSGTFNLHMTLGLTPRLAGAVGSNLNTGAVMTVGCDASRTPKITERGVYAV